MKIEIMQIPSSHKVTVLSDYLRINYTTEYIKSLTGLGDCQSRKVLYYLGQLYDEDKGISKSVILDVSKGVQSGLL